MNAIEHDALKRFVKATEEFEARFGAAIIGLYGPRSQTGELYIEYLNGKGRQEGLEYNESFGDADDATKATFTRLSEIYPANSALTLYWRVKPEIDYFQSHSGQSDGYRTYCRFLL